MKTYGVGLIGCGSVLAYHRHAFERSKRVRCVCAYDPSRERAAAAVAALGGRVARDPSEVFESSEVDLVAVLSPAYTHAELVEAGARRGKHFMLEKPLAGSLAEAERIVRSIREAGVLCFHPTLRALYPDLFGRLQELSAADGPLGPLRCGLLHIVADSFPWASWFQDKSKCLPAAEYGSHALDTFLALSGARPRSVFAHAGRHCRDFDQHDITTIIVNFHDGQFFQMNINWVLQQHWGGAGQRWDLVCRRGAIRHSWSGAEWSGDQERGTYLSPRQPTQGHRWEHYDQLAAALDHGGTVSPNEGDGLAYMRILDAAMRSIQSGQTVDLDPPAHTPRNDPRRAATGV